MFKMLEHFDFTFFLLHCDSAILTIIEFASIILDRFVGKIRFCDWLLTFLLIIVRVRLELHSLACIPLAT